MSAMRGGQDDEPDDGDPGDAAAGSGAMDTGPILPPSSPRAPSPMIDPSTRSRPGATTWYRTDEDRARSVYRRANPWYRRLARGVIGLAFLAVAMGGAYAGARAIQDYLDRDRLPGQGAEVPEIRETSFLVTSAAPAPAVDGTLTLDASTGAFDFVGRASGPQSGLHVLSPDGSTVYVRRGSAPWRAASGADADAVAVRTAVDYLADDDSADAILTNRLRRGFVELVDRVVEGAGADRLTRYELRLATDRFAREFPLQWQQFQQAAVPGATPAVAAPMTIWLDADEVLVRVSDPTTNWAWERLAYSADPFVVDDPADDTSTRVVQVACVSDDDEVFWQTPLASCTEALAAARDAATDAGLDGAFADLDRSVARLCSIMEREDGPVGVSDDEAALARTLVAAGVCRGDLGIFGS